MRPSEAAVEETLVNKNAASSLKLGQARGVVLLAAAHAGLAVTEYAAKTVKRAVVGTGAAEKRQVAMMVRCSCRARADDRPTPPTRWRSPSATPITAATLRSLAGAPAPAGPRAMIARLPGRLDSVGEDLR